MEHLGGLLNVSSQFTQLQELIDLWTGRACVSLSKGGCLYKCGFLSVCTCGSLVTGLGSLALASGLHSYLHLVMRGH